MNVSKARDHLPELVNRAAAGEIILLERRGRPLAALVPLRARAVEITDTATYTWTNAPHSNSEREHE